MVRAIIRFMLRMAISVVANALRPELPPTSFKRRIVFFFNGRFDEVTWEFVDLEYDEVYRQALGLRHRHWLEDYD